MLPSHRLEATTEQRRGFTPINTARTLSFMYTRVSRKSKRTYYTEARVAAARDNISTYPWARKMADKAARQAKPYVANRFDTLFSMITPQSVPRASRIHEIAGCPVCGDEINTLGMFPYIFEPEGDAWTIGCPLCETVFPSNDFGAYYESGLNDRGFFDPNLADRSLLVNTRYPNKPQSWLVDDGCGGLDESGVKFMFVAHYNHWAIWGFPMVNLSDYGRIFTALFSLRDAYLYTGEIEYADALVVLLYRIASVYPEMDIGAYPWEDGYCNSSGGSDMGKIAGRIWECRVTRDFIFCYDAVFDALQENRCQSALQFLKSRDEVCTPDMVIDHIEGALVRDIFAYVESGQIRGNKGMHESTLGLAAVVLDDEDTAVRWLDWLYSPGDEDYNRTPQVSGGNLENVLTDQVDRDGMGDEASPSYNSIWIHDMKVLADALDGWDGLEQYRLYEHPVYRKMFTPYAKLIMIGAYLPTIADSGKCGDPGYRRRGAIAEFYAIEGFARYGIRDLARFASFLNEQETADLHLDIFSADQKETTDTIKEITANLPPFGTESVNLTGYGFAAIREKRSWDAWMYYGRSFGHGHSDSLTIGLHAFGLDLSPDLGNPEHKNKYNRMTYEWFKNTINHNTVVVDESRQDPAYGSLPRAFASGKVCGIIDVEAPAAYPQTSLYRRGIVTVRVGASDFYIIDFFRVRGGDTHHYSFHGAEGSISYSDLHTNIQNGGSYAGEDIPYGHPYDAGDAAITEYIGSGFHYLDNVERDSSPNAPFAVEWRIDDTWSVHKSPIDIRLRHTMLADVDEVALADGRPASNYIGNPERLRYMVARRSGENLESHFVSLIEGYSNNRHIKSIQRIELRWADTNQRIEDHDSTAGAVRIDLYDGSTDYVFTSLVPDRVLMGDDSIRFAGMYAMLRIRNAKVEHHLLYGGTLLELDETTVAQSDIASVRGVVTDFTRERSTENHITIRVSRGDISAIQPGSWVYVENRWDRANRRGEVIPREPEGRRGEKPYGDIRNGAFEIFGVQLQHARNTIVLDIGDATLIERFLDPIDHAKGYLCSVEVGDSLDIPIVLGDG
jgi:oligo-alginate lyase